MLRVGQNDHCFFRFSVERSCGIPIKCIDDPYCVSAVHIHFKDVSLWSYVDVGWLNVIAELKELIHQAPSAARSQVRLSSIKNDGPIAVDFSSPKISGGLHATTSIGRKGFPFRYSKTGKSFGNLFRGNRYKRRSLTLYGTTVDFCVSRHSIYHDRGVGSDKSPKLFKMVNIGYRQFESYLISLNAAISHQKSCPISRVWRNSRECGMVYGISAIAYPFLARQYQLLGIHHVAGNSRAPDNDRHIPIIDTKCDGNIFRAVPGSISFQDLIFDFVRNYIPHNEGYLTYTLPSVK